MTTGEKINQLRKQNNYTQENLASLMGVSRQSISKWESDSSYPETDKLIQLSNLFNCSLDYLLKDTKENFEEKQNQVNKYTPYLKGVMYFLIILALAWFTSNSIGREIGEFIYNILH